MAVDPALPHSPACERNREPIAGALATLAVPGERVLEIGSGTGQHAVHLAPRLALDWQPTDLEPCLPGIAAWIRATGAVGVRPPQVLDVERGPWPPGPFQGVFSANTAHILSWQALTAMLRGLARVLAPGGWFALYGPFRQGGRFSGPGDARLDAWARASFPGGGLRELEEVRSLAAACGLDPVADLALPANNRLLAWRRAGAGAAFRED